MSPYQSFEQRLGLNNPTPIDNDFPGSTRVGLAYVIEGLISSNCLTSNALERELNEICRPEKPYSWYYGNGHEDLVAALSPVQWTRLFDLCEGLYLACGKQVLDDNDFPTGEVILIEETRKLYEDKINRQLSSDNLDYVMENGQFQRRGLANTQTAIAQGFKVMSHPLLQQSRKYYNKAVEFFRDVVAPDFENSILESAKALEAAVESLTNEGKTVRDFAYWVKKLDRIHPTVQATMDKMHAYRNSASGVAHSAPSSMAVGEADAALVLSMTSALITYLFEKYPPNDLIPF